MDNRSIHYCYQLKPSRFALGFQFLGLSLMLILIYLTSPIWAVISCFFIAGGSLIIFRNRYAVYQLEQLDYELWSVQYLPAQKIQQVQINRFIDHTFYISVHFEDKKLKPFIIWQDQVDEYQWKSLKTRCKF